jgi:uncharacterized cupin superfamily protein
MRRFNWHEAELAADDDEPEGYAPLYAIIGEEIGGEHLAGALYALDPGQKMAPYHWEGGQEEWLVVLSGRPTVRTPDERRELRPGDVVCFVRGPEGAHQVINETDEPARMIMLSERRDPNVIVYPDSNKLAARSGNLWHPFRIDTEVDYWDREP